MTNSADNLLFKFERCPDCGGEYRDDCRGGTLYDGRKPLGTCPSKTERDRLRRVALSIELSKIPRLFLKKTFDNYDDSDNPEALDAVKAWAAKPVGFVYLCGPVGIGKTHLSCAALQKIIEGGSRAHYRTQPDIVASVMPSAMPSRDIVDDTINFARLVIDDLGAARNTEFALETTYRIINGRYGDMRPTIIASNLTLKEMAGLSLDMKRVSERIGEMCKLDGGQRYLIMKGETRRW